MKNENIIRQILDYFRRNSQTGHTTAMMRGAESNPEAIVVAHSTAFAAQLKRVTRNRVISLYEAGRILEGQQGVPLLIDHKALEELFERGLDEAYRLRTRIAKLKDDLEAEARARAEAQRERDQMLDWEAWESGTRPEPGAKVLIWCDPYDGQEGPMSATYKGEDHFSVVGEESSSGKLIEVQVRAEMLDVSHFMVINPPRIRSATFDNR